MPNFFIDRPIFAWVIAILIVLGGVLTIFNLGVESYPTIAPQQVVVSATYQGADADTVEKTVTQVIEQQLVGIDNLDYFSSTSSSSGSATITLTFAPGTDPDIAQVQTQNKVSLAESRLPTEVTQLGVTVAKQSAGFLMVAALKSDDGSMDAYALNNLLASQVLDQVQRIPGVGSATQFGSEYAMRIWLNPDKLQGYGLSSAQVLDAVKEQNVQIAAGNFGSSPSGQGNRFTAPAVAEGRFTHPEQFENILLRSDAQGAAVRLKDVARVELGPFTYGRSTSYNKQPIAGFAIQLLTGANALNVANAVKAKLDELKPTFPPGVSWFVPYDSTTFIVVSVEDVVITLLEAIALVFVVMLVFLQNMRMTIIALLVIPVALMGGFLGMLAVGFTINQLSLFGMVLVIGIVVDDAIVVIENVERIMAEEGLSPKDATRKAMSQISGALVAIALVLMAVFIPSAMQSGSAGAIYRQFCLTIAISVGFSAFLALAFTPALCATLLKPTHGQEKNFFFRGFNRAFSWMQNKYTGHITGAIRHMPTWMIVFLVVTLACGFVFTRLPSGFVPNEDQGYALVVVGLAPGSNIDATTQVLDQVDTVIRRNEMVEGVITIAGYSFVGVAENVGMAFIRLKPWDDRSKDVEQLIQEFNQSVFAEVKDAQVFVVNLPTIQGLGQFSGFDMYLQDRAGLGHEALVGAQGSLLQRAAQESGELTAVRPNGLSDAPQVNLKVDRVQARSMGLSLGDVNTAIQLMLAPVYANDFFYGGRVLRVNMQADLPYRLGPDALNQFYVPSSTQTVTTDGKDLPAMIPLANVVSADWTMSSPSLVRYNGYPAIEFVGSPAAGKSSGEAMNAMQNIVKNDLPHGFGFDWAGQSRQEILSGNQAPLLYALSLLVVFLCLAALYESWSVPVAVLLVVPLGVLGAALATELRGLTNDVYFKIGIITIIGLAAKNAILIIEFAIDERKNGRPLGAAVIDAARLRIRPILMTSLAFILGVFPMVIASGAGANSRHAIGTGVVFGMLFATVLGLLFIPIFYVFVRRLLGERLESREETQAALKQELHGNA